MSEWSYALVAAEFGGMENVAVTTFETRAGASAMKAIVDRELPEYDHLVKPLPFPAEGRYDFGDVGYHGDGE